MRKTLILFISIFLLIACTTSQTKNHSKQQKKNVILVIADGAGPNIMTYLMEYARLAPNSPYKNKKSNLEKIFNDGKNGIVFNYTDKTIVTDSAAAGTQFATGVKTNPYSIGVDAKGKRANSVLHNAKQKGYATGILTDVYILDATPSAFYAHRQSRKMRDGIIEDLTITQPDLILGGGLNYFVSKSDLKNTKYQQLLKNVPYIKEVRAQAKKDENLSKVLDSGYNLVFTKQEMNNLNDGKILGLFAPTELPTYFPKDWQGPSLLDMTKKAISLLSKNEKGFFLLVEAGNIDWTAHVNDPQALLQELLEFDETLGYIKKFADKNENTLVIVTADHDTGGFGFNYYTPYNVEEEEYNSFEKFTSLASGKIFVYDVLKKYKALPEEQKNSDTIKKMFKEYFGFQEPLDFLDGETDFFTAYKHYWSEQGIVWNTTKHTNGPLFVVFYGDNAKVKGNVFHNTELFKVMNSYLK